MIFHVAVCSSAHKTVDIIGNAKPLRSTSVSGTRLGLLTILRPYLLPKELYDRSAFVIGVPESHTSGLRRCDMGRYDRPWCVFLKMRRTVRWKDRRFWSWNCALWSRMTPLVSMKHLGCFHHIIGPVFSGKSSKVWKLIGQRRIAATSFALKFVDGSKAKLKPSQCRNLWHQICFYFPTWRFEVWIFDFLRQTVCILWRKSQRLIEFRTFQDGGSPWKSLLHLLHLLFLETNVRFWHPTKKPLWFHVYVSVKAVSGVWFTSSSATQSS